MSATRSPSLDVAHQASTGSGDGANLRSFASTTS